MYTGSTRTTPSVYPHLVNWLIVTLLLLLRAAILTVPTLMACIVSMFDSDNVVTLK